jgi:hypothetical protein
LSRCNPHSVDLTRNQPVLLQDWGDHWIDSTGRFTEEVARRRPFPGNAPLPKRDLPVDDRLVGALHRTAGARR